MLGRMTRSADGGAVAIFVALLAVVLFGVGALAVDLTNAMERRRQVQTVADVAALAGGGEAKNPCKAFESAWMYLQKNENAVRSDGVNSNFSNVTKADQEDTDPHNGEIYIYRGTMRLTGLAGATASACPQTGVVSKVRVVAPKRTVAFGLANAIGFKDVDVQAAATVGTFNAGDILPIFIPRPCANGSQTVKMGPQPPAAPFTPSGSTTGPWVDNSIAPSPVVTGSSPTITVLTNKNLGGSGVTSVIADFWLGATRVTAAANTGWVANSGNTSGQAQIPVPPQVMSTVGLWTVRLANVASDGTETWGPDNKTASFEVTSPPGQCGFSQTGDFGLLESPRRNGNPADWIRDNLREGMDHGVVTHPGPLPPSSQNQVCFQGGTQQIANSVLDDDATRNDANCLSVLTGNKPDAVTDGLIGTAANPGRLRSPSGNSCPAPVGSVNPSTVLNEPVVNSTLRCYLRGSYTVDDLVNRPVPDMLKVEILDDPRFFFLPVFNTDLPPQNGNYPIVKFVGGFITDERPGVAPTPSNGIQEGQAKIDNLTALLFTADALPLIAETENPTLPYNGSGPLALALIE